MLGKGQDLEGAILFLGFSELLEDKIEASNQLRLLQASQGGTYKAYISSSVNEALSIKMKSTDAILGLFKALKPTSSQNINIQNNANINTSVKAIGMSEALQILSDQGLTKVSYDPNAYPQILADLGPNIPEVRANFMDASNTDGMKLISKQNADPDANPDPKAHHRNRRSLEEDIDEESFL
jgi:hypothetical protein